MVSVLASGTQDRGFKPGRSRRIFRAKNPAESVGILGRKYPQHAFLRRGCKAICPMSQICGMLKTPGNYVEVGFPGQICRPFLAHFRSSLPEGSHVAWRGAPLGSTGGTKGGAQRACWLTALVRRGNSPVTAIQSTITHLQEHKTTASTASGNHYTVIDGVKFTDKEYR